MKFSTREDIEAPIEYVFSRMTDFDGLERQAMRRGIEVKRKNPEIGNVKGAAWRLKVPFRGKLRDLDAELIQFDATNVICVEAVSGGLRMEVTIELLALSPARTRVGFGYEVRPESLSARILVQSVKFAKATLTKRFKKRVANFCKYIEAQYELTK